MSETKRVGEAFKNGKALVAYLMAGDPTPEKSGAYMLAAQNAGADLIEIGIPFSDPIAEGPVIQQASVRALAAGTGLEDIFAMVEGLRPKIHVPIAFMTYLNPVFVYGYSRFFTRCNACGVSALIIPDLPLEEQAEVKEQAFPYGIDIVSLIAPTSAQRIAKIAAGAEGFIYLVSSLGVTGVRTEITTDIPVMMEEIRAVTDVPVAVGFGISTPQQAGQYAAMSDGAIVGSAIVRLIAEHGENAEGPVAAYIRQLKAGLG